MKAFSRIYLTPACRSHVPMRPVGRASDRKTFGHDLERPLLASSSASFSKKSRSSAIDHYLAKESMQNILAFSVFANSALRADLRRESSQDPHQPLRQMAPRSRRSYDPLRRAQDVGQNHLLAMLAAVAMDRPRNHLSSGYSRARADVPINAQTALPAAQKCTMRAIYRLHYRKKVCRGIRRQKTYFRLKSFVKSSRWKGVPFYLESARR